MKKIKVSRYLIMAASLVIAALLFVFGKGHEHASGIALANMGAVALTAQEKEGFSEQEQKVILAVKKLAEQMKTDLAEKKISKEEIQAAVQGIQVELGGKAKSLTDQLKDLHDIALKQGTSLQELSQKYNGIETGNKTIAQVLEESKGELESVYNQGSGAKQFMINVNEKGQFVARPFTPTQKAADLHATIANVGGGSGTASIAQSIDAASLLRMGAGAPIVSQYRNSPWLFDLCNLQNASFDFPMAIWYDESAKQGASAEVAEGGTKPRSQYAYTLKTATYRKEATLLGFTDEFSLDFQRLQSDIIGKGRVDLINRINTAILARVISAATTYNTETSFKQGVAVPSANDWDVLAAMAAQVDNATFGGVSANAAIVSTFKKYRMGVLKSTQGDYLNPPAVINGLSIVGNPDMSADNVLVGDFKQYNIILRGGLIMKVGYNGTDFANNQFSVVLEQFYYDYISTIRKAAIVSGPDFATIKTAIGS